MRFTVHEYLKGSGPTAAAGGGARRPRLPRRRPRPAYRRGPSRCSCGSRPGTHGRRCSSSRRRRRRTPRPPRRRSDGKPPRPPLLGRLAVHALEPQPVAVGLQRGHAEPGLAAGAGHAGRGRKRRRRSSRTARNRRRPPSPWPTCGPGSRHWRRNCKAGEGVDGYASCIYGRILRERYRRADPWTPPCRNPRRWAPGQRPGLK